MGIKIGELLVKAGFLSEGQLRAALVEQHKWGGKLGETLVRMNYCSEEVIVKAISKQLGIPVADLDSVGSISEAALRKVSPEMAREQGVLPLHVRDEGKTLVLAMLEPQNLRKVDELYARTGCRIVPMLVGAGALARAHSRYYGGQADIDSAEGGSFKLTDAQGRTLISDIRDIKPPVQRSAARQELANIAQDPSEILVAMEALQRKEVAALKVIVEILIEKGVFTRDEYLARVRR